MAADDFGVITFPNNFDRYLDKDGQKATGAGSALVTGRVVHLTNSTGLWAQATSGDAGRIGVVPKIYWGNGVNTDSSNKCVILTGNGAEVCTEASGTIKPGAKLVPGDGGTFKTWTSGAHFAVYKHHYGEGTAGQPATDATTGDKIIVSLEQG